MHSVRVCVCVRVQVPQLHEPMTEHVRAIDLPAAAYCVLHNYELLSLYSFVLWSIELESCGDAYDSNPIRSGVQENKNNKTEF